MYISTITYVYICRCEGVLSTNVRIMHSTRGIHTLYIYIPTYIHTYSGSCTYKEKSYRHTHIYIYTQTDTSIT